MATKYIYQWEGDRTQPLEDGFTWKSKKVLLPSRTAFGCARVVAGTGDRQAYYESLVARSEAIARNAARISGHVMGGAIGENVLADVGLAINGDLLETVPSAESYTGNFALVLNLYVDGTLRFTKDVYASDVPFRLSQGYRGRTFEVEIAGNVEVKRIDVATSMKELKILQQQGGE